MSKGEGGWKKHTLRLQVCPGEAENISHLLKLCHKTDKVEVTVRILSGITEGVCRPLKSRIEQILVSETSAIVLYKLTNLIRFYETTISDVLKCKFVYRLLYNY